MPYVHSVEVEKYLKGIGYPISKGKLITHAQLQGASQDVIGVFTQLREENFNSPMEVFKAIGEIKRE